MTTHSAAHINRLLILPEIPKAVVYILSKSRATLRGRVPFLRQFSSYDATVLLNDVNILE